MTNKINVLKNNSIEILKAETAALLFNLGKTHFGLSIWKNKVQPIINEIKFKDIFGYEKFGKYNVYYNKGYYKLDMQINKISQNSNNILLDFINNADINIKNKRINFIEIMKGNVSNEEFVKKVFVRGCENINSGIDKGNPDENKQQLEILWLSNAFGSYKEQVNSMYLDEKRRNFFENLFYFLKENNYFTDPSWREIRKYIFENIKKWYSHLLSDSRYPINDVSLWDQAYMTATMFKSALAAIILDDEKFEEYQKNPQDIKWCILGVQYDKKSLYEKALKCSYIQGYKEIIKEIDNKVKSLIEIKYALSNEIYRDETGIYFLAPENIKGEKIETNSSFNFYNIHNDLSLLEKEIYEIFKEESDSEIFPCILCTEKSKGLLNLSKLLENARDNFLNKKIYSLPKIKKASNNICQVCGVRTAETFDGDYHVCDICLNRRQLRVKNWFENLEKETIWTGELQDENGKIALIILKFDLDLWLNGEMMSGLLVREGENKDKRFIVNKIIKNIKQYINNPDTFYTSCEDNEKKENNIHKFIEYFDKKGIQDIFENITNTKNYQEYLSKSYNNLKKYKREKKELLFKTIKIVYCERNQNYCTYFKKDIENILNNQLTQNGNINIEDIVKLDKDKEVIDLENNHIKDNTKLINYIRDLVSIGFIILQIKNIIFERIIHLKNKEINYLISDGKIDIKERRIKWDNLNDRDIEILSKLLYQFLITKSPSPARLKRIWDSTQNFMEEVNQSAYKILDLDQEKYRNYRLIFRVDQSYPEGLYKYKGLDFYYKSGNILLITSLSKAKKFIFKDDSAKEIINNNLDVDELKYLLKPITIEKVDDKKKKNDKKEKITLKPDNLVEICRYKPAFAITSPSPISTQLIIPADKVQDFIKKVQEIYMKHFKWVYGKLPLHIGVVVQDYKMPLYIGIKALRKMERQLEKPEDIEKTALVLDEDEMKKLPCKFEDYGKDSNDYIYKFYSLYKTNDEGFEFFFLNNEARFSIPLDSNTTKEVQYTIYPNTIDFEFLDTNTRINDIYYNKKTYQRYLKLKNNRPYTWEEWKKFEIFKEIFHDNLKTKLNNLISLLYSKLYDWQVIEGKNYDDFKKFCAALFYNTLELKNNEDIVLKLYQIFGIKQDDNTKANFIDNILNLENVKFIKSILMFLDMYEFWHKALKEV